MKLRKTLIIVTSIFGVYSTVRKYQKKKRTVSAKLKIVTLLQTNKYLLLSQEQVLSEFKKRIAAGEWLSKDEYTQMMEAMRNK